MTDSGQIAFLAGLFVTALLVGFSGALTPGPILTYVVAESAHSGHTVGPRVVLGHVLLEAALVIAVALGIGSLLTLPAITLAVSLLGGLFLLWLAYGMIRGALSGRLALRLDAGRPASRIQRPVMAGVLLSASNPFFTIWWATVGIGFISQALVFGVLGLAVFYAGHALSDLTWYWGVSGLVSTGRRYVSQSMYRGVVLVCGLFLIGLAGFFLVEAMRRLPALA